jgi:hypothetical protein
LTTTNEGLPKAGRATRGWSWQAWSDLLAKLAALGVLGLGLFIVIFPVAKHGQHFGRDPDEARTTTSTVVARASAATAMTTVVAGPGGTTTTAVTGSPSPLTTTTMSVGEESRSLVDRALGTGGFFLFRVALACIAAFLAGAVVQRALRGKFAIKLPFVEFGDLPEAAAASTEALEKLKSNLNDQLNSVVERMGESLSASAEATANAIGALNHRLNDQLSSVVERVDERLSASEKVTTNAIDALGDEMTALKGSVSDLRRQSEELAERVSRLEEERRRRS